MYVKLLNELFEAAVAAASPASCLPAYLPAAPPGYPARKGRTLVVGAGKAAAGMAKVVEEQWDGPVSGLVVTRYGHGMPLKTIELVEAGHPLPDAAGQRAAARMLEQVTELSAGDRVIGLFSGGGSALLALPAPGVSLDHKQTVTRALLRRGANIREINNVRKHLSAIKGGRLAAACAPASVVTLMISDVPGDDPSSIASGPTVPDPTTRAEALAVLRKYGITQPRAVIDSLQNTDNETPKPGDPCFDNTRHEIAACTQDALEAAAELAIQRGYAVLILGDLEGEARDVALVQAGIVRQILRFGQPESAPCVVLSGGETTVTVRGGGRGGRNAEFALALAIALEGLPGVYALAADTDGIDGTEDNAGCIVHPDTLKKAADKGVDAETSLVDNDAYSVFQASDGLIKTGPTRTNVNDFRAILVTG
ncbi:MAG: putative hydroxypyruvate reductase [Gammaproteobacteria bacterium]|nr:putative hydroxypyruvate reductase [Gammaproteobacteria bacterium]